MIEHKVNKEKEMVSAAKITPTELCIQTESSTEKGGQESKTVELRSWGFSRVTRFYHPVFAFVKESDLGLLRGKGIACLATLHLKADLCLLKIPLF